MTLVVDASVVVPACSIPDGFKPYADDDLVAPPLMWSEARSVLHRFAWRSGVRRDVAFQALGRLERGPVRSRSPRQLGFEAWRIADELGWAKTYDAEYLALARLLGCQLVTADARLHRAGARLGLTVAPTEL